MSFNNLNNLNEAANELVSWLYQRGGSAAAVPLEDFAGLHRLTEDEVDVLWRDLHDRGLAEQLGMGGARLRLTPPGVRVAEQTRNGTGTSGAATTSASVQYNTNIYGVSYGTSVGGTGVVQKFDVHHAFDADAVVRIAQEFRHALSEAQGFTDDDRDDLQDRADLIEEEAQKDDPDDGKIRRHMKAVATKVGTEVTKGAITVGGERLIELVHQWQSVIPGHG